MTENFATQQARFRAGAQLGGYQLEAAVGAGGMAVVYRARDERLNRLVALKVLNPEKAADPAFRRRFIAESRAAASVESPYIIPIYSADEAAGVLFIAMRYVHSGDLRRVVADAGPLPLERAMGCISPVASALDAAHAAGLVHRDVKPANILVDTRPGQPEHVYLSDFGIAKSGFLPAPTMTAPGVILATPQYAAPEQIKLLEVDGRADQYALACVAYWLLTGDDPFQGSNALAVLSAHVHEPPPLLTARRPDLPAAADAVLARAMAKAPGQRYGSCGDFADALGDALGVLPRRAGSPVVSGSPVDSGMPVDPGMPVDSGMPAGADETVTVPVLATTPLLAAPAVADDQRPAEADELYQAWQDSVGQAARPRMKPPQLQRPQTGPAQQSRRRMSTRQRWLVRAGGPLAFIATAVAVIALAMPRHAGTVGSAANTSKAAGTTFPGYPGKHGTVTVDSTATADGRSVAAGSADGLPALWRRDAGGQWRLATTVSSAVAAAPGALTSVAHGALGWIAVGETGSRGTSQPLAVTSADGVKWQVSQATFGGPGPVVTAVAAGPDGYVVVGRHVSGNRVYAAMWWSADLRNWSQANNDAGGVLDGRLQQSMAEAVAATADGFVATGMRGSDYAIWTSGETGQQWTFDPMAPPAPASSAVLNAVTVSRAGVEVAAGEEVVNGRDVPVVAVPVDSSMDSGQRWRLIRLDTSGGQGQVTALTANGTGFVVAGRTGPAAHSRAVTWTLRSAAGPSGWSKVVPVPAP